MSETKNLMGLNLSVDNDLIAEAAKEAIIAGIASSMEMKDQIVHEFVKSMLSERVLVEDGSKPRGYSSEKTCSRLEWVVRKHIIEMVREEVAKMVEEQKPLLREAVRKELMKSQTRSKLVDMFVKSLSDSLTNVYRTKIDLTFEESKD